MSSIESSMEPRNDSPVIKDLRKRRTRRPSALIEEVAGPAAPPKRVRQRLIKQKDPMDVGTRRHKFRRYIHPVHGMARPVKFRFRAITIKEYRHSHQKRVRVTRQIYNHRVHQYHMDPEKGKRNVPELTVAETVENFLEASKTVMPRSQKVHDEIVAVGVEYEDSIKMLHFGRSMKKHSCKQKRANLQKSWWPMKRLEEKARLRRGPQWISMDRPYKINEDPILFKNHWAFCPRKNSPLQTIREVYTKNLMRRRATDDIILDSSFFVREFHLPKSSINLRITRSSDIPEVHVPPIMNCGYFPYSAKTVENKKDYLAARFKEAQLEYFNLTYRDIEPWTGFRVATISDTELYNFHRLGKHLHGFFLVWEKIGKKNLDRTKTHANGRYLVDMFNFQFFPLDVNFTKWEHRLRIAFDKVTVYNLHLAEILRANKPVFDSLARNPSFFKPLTLKEIVQVMTELGMSPKDYINKSGKRAFYEWGLEKTNEAYLSAYFIICSGSKIIQKNKKCVLEHPAVLVQGQKDVATMTKDGKVYHMEIPKMPTEFLVNLDDWKHNRGIQRVLVHGPMTKEEADTTNLITDTPRVDAATEVEEAPKKAIRLDTMTRKELIFVRNRCRGLPPPRLTMKKKKAPSSKPGRKPDTIQDKMLRKHDFNLPYLASDIESDYEDFLSGDEDYEEERPMLKRSESSESVFANICKTDRFFDKVSGFYRQKINLIVHPSAQRKSRKMNRIAKKHILRYRMLNQDGIAFKEMLECYHGNLPKLGSEITRTKKAIRVNGYKRFKVAKVFEKGESAKIDVIGDLLKEMVTHVVAQENAESRAANGISRMAQRVRMAQRLTIENLKPANSGLPAAPYVAMELLTRTKMSGRKMLEEEKKKLRRSVNEQYEEFASTSAVEKKEMDVRFRAQQKEIRLDDVEDREFERERHLNRKLVIVPFDDKRTIQAQDRKTERRRLSRLELTKRERIAKNKERESAKLKESGLSVTEFLRQTALEDAERERKKEEEEEERRRRQAAEASRRAMETKRREEAIEIQKKKEEMITEILINAKEEQERRRIEDEASESRSTQRIKDEGGLRRSAPEDVHEVEVTDRRRLRSAQRKVRVEEDPVDKRKRRLEHQRDSKETRQYADLKGLDHQRGLARRARALKEEKEQLRIEKEMEEVLAQRQEDLRRLKEEQDRRARKADSLDNRYRSKTPESPSDKDEESSDDDEQPADEKEKIQEDVPDFEFVRPSKTATPIPRPAPYHDESEYEDEGEEDADEATDPIAAEARFQLNLRTFMTQSVELDTKRDKAKRREKEIIECVDKLEEMNAELHRLRSTYAGQLRECENVDDADAAIKLDLARETSKKIRQRNEETKELEANLKERLLKMDQLQFKISILMDEVEYATINLSVLDMTPEQKKMWDGVRKLVTMDETSDPKKPDEPRKDTEETSEDSNEPSDDPEHPLGEENHSAPTALSPLSSSRCTSDSSKLLLSYSKIQAIKDSVGRSMSRSTDSRISSSQPPSQAANGHSNGVSSSQPSTSSSDQRSDATAPQPSTSSSTTAPNASIASGEGRRRGRKREATTHLKEADKRPRN